MRVIISFLCAYDAVGQICAFCCACYPERCRISYSGHDLAPAAICDLVSGTGLAARPASLAPAGDRKKGTAAIADKHGHDSLSRSRLAAFEVFSPLSQPEEPPAAKRRRIGRNVEACLEEAVALSDRGPEDLVVTSHPERAVLSASTPRGRCLAHQLQEGGVGMGTEI